MSENLPGLIPIRGTVQHYEWGGYQFIPNLMQTPNPDSQPFAELWLGAHPSAPAIAQVGETHVSLDTLFAEHTTDLLGESAQARFAGRLPYLFKVLDARKMLSIQAHPTKQEAEAGFARENAAGIARNATERNYKDDNHKPEVHVALTDFWMLHSFRPLEEIAQMMERAPELATLQPDFATRLASLGTDEAGRQSLLRELYERVMTLPQTEVDAILNPLLDRLATGTATEKNDPDFWALRAAKEFPLPGNHRDRGIFSVYLLNLVSLRPGQGTYQPAGTLHAYLEGVNMELMANSDNVLRGGLTPKHVDVPELLSILDFKSGMPPILSGMAVAPSETIYPTPASEFVLSCITISSGETYSAHADNGPDTLFVLEGSVSIESGADSQTIPRGNGLLVSFGKNYTITANSGAAILYKAAIPG